MEPTRRCRYLLLVVALSLVLLPGFAPRAEATGLVLQPGRPEQGFGSSAGYISRTATRFEAGVADQGTQVYWFVPSVLHNGDSAPVVVFLHGYSAIAPELYQGHIDHLTRQGYIVVYPQFQKTGASFFGDTNQNEMLRRAIASTDVALRRLGRIGERNSLYLYGHSLGGLLAATWVSAGGARPAGIVAAHPSLGGGLPDWVRALFPIEEIDPALAAATRCPVLILTGDADTVAPPSEAIELYDALTNARSRTVVQASSDAHGLPSLRADHIGPLSLFGLEDALDHRFYEAALDAMIAGALPVSFDLGAWSDGRAVTEPEILRTGTR